MGEASTALQLIDGTSEHAAFFDGLFGVTHLPAGTPRAGLVVCSPIFSEFLKNNRREVRLGRRLAAEGIAVQRFHYRGTGHSDDLPDGLTLESMGADARIAAGRLDRLTGVGDPAVLGTLIGSFPAVELAGPTTPIVLWEPVVDGARYFRNLMRTLAIVAMSKGTEYSTESIEAEFEHTGALELAGFSIPRSLRDSARPRKLQSPSGPGHTMIVQLGRKPEVSPSTARLAQRFTDAGRQIRIEPVPAREAWWFHQDVDKLRPEESAMLDSAMIEPTVRWLSARAAG